MYTMESLKLKYKYSMEPSKSKYNLSTNLEEVEEKIGYKFNNPLLLKEAFTHHSYHHSNEGILDHQDKICEDSTATSHERLEYIGDSILNLLISREVFLSYPHLKPGMLTRLRAANVDTEKLARVAIHHNFHHYLLHKMPLLTRRIEEFTNEISHYPLHSNGLVDAPKVLADVVESIIGAVYMDCNFSMEIIWKLVKSLVHPIITPETLHIHPVTKLYEMCQKNGSVVKVNDMWKKNGEIEVFINGEFAGRGEYHSKKIIALNRAANNAWHHIMENKIDVEDKAAIDDDLNISSLFLE